MENPLAALSSELAAAVERSSEWVVAVHGRPRVPSSGVHWKPGVIVTAEHTLRRDDDVRVTLPDGKTVPAQIAGRDSGTDLAVLRVDADGAGSHPILASAALRTGNLVLAVGRSPETGPNASLGVISSVAGPWHTWKGGRVDRFLRLDLSLYPGSSGGVTIDASGHMIGLTTGGLSRTSPMAIPIQTIERVAAALLEKGHVTRGYLGVGLQPVAVPEHLKTQLGITAKTGLIVLSAEPRSPAGLAGIVIGDVLLSLDGKPVSDTDDVQNVLGPEYVGKEVKATLVRGGSLAEAVILIGERPQRRA